LFHVFRHPYIEREWWKHANRFTNWVNWEMKRDVIGRETCQQHANEKLCLKALARNHILPNAIRVRLYFHF
jgi:hypothetical protein